MEIVQSIESAAKDTQQLNSEITQEVRHVKLQPSGSIKQTLLLRSKG